MAKIPSKLTTKILVDLPKKSVVNLQWKIIGIHQKSIVN